MNLKCKYFASKKSILFYIVQTKVLMDEIFLSEINAQTIMSLYSKYLQNEMKSICLAPLGDSAKDLIVFMSKADDAISSYLD